MLTEQKIVSCIYLVIFTENYLPKIAVVTENAKFTQKYKSKSMNMSFI